MAADLYARALTYLHTLPPSVVAAGVLALLVVLLTLVSGDPTRCDAARAGRRCVHDTHHRGAHRDELGNYWN